MKQTFANTIGFTYKHVLRPIIFLSSSESVHANMTNLGQIMGKSSLSKKFLSTFLSGSHPMLSQEISGINFSNPMGLSAGFDYKAKLTQILPSLDFGFETVGTITHKSYEGNTGPLLGRLIKSRSLMVNKGFKNEGIKSIVQKLNNSHFSIPVGLSIGKTNSEIMTQDEAIKDILGSFIVAEKSKVPFSYYELNISCPNLHGNVEFYSKPHLRKLLKQVCSLKLKKPLFIKMPITLTDGEVSEMLSIISAFPVTGVIFGNLQKNRNDPSLIPSEVAKFNVGNFSGKPTEKRSNELIRLVYRQYGKRFIVIGCGGVFSAQDAYKKIRLGASLVQFITGLIFEGPQLTYQINSGLERLLRKDGFTHLSQAIGVDA